MNKQENLSMKHDYEHNIKCPYCDWEDHDSWEFGEDEGMLTCGNCEKEFNVVRNIEVTYSTTRINCEENGAEHDYQFESVFIRNQKFENGVWNKLSENEWTYKRIMMCSICGDKEYVEISKDEYKNELANTA